LVLGVEVLDGLLAVAEDCLLPPGLVSLDRFAFIGVGRGLFYLCFGVLLCRLFIFLLRLLLCSFGHICELFISKVE
jgi:hypothetical protein